MAHRISIIGDIGYFAPELKDMMSEDSSGSTILAGDLFYPYLRDIGDFRKIKEFFPQRKIYPVLGNHDYDADVLPYFNRKRTWDFPYPYYFRRIAGISVWFIDTQILDVKNKDFNFEEEISGMYYDYREVKKDHVSWLRSSFEEHRHDEYKLIVGHYPCISAGPYGDNNVLKRILFPLMRKYNVNGYISGHDHSTQFLTREYRGHTINQIIAGGAGSTSPYDLEHDNFIFYYSGICFVTVEISDGDIVLKYTDGDEVVFETRI